MQSQTNPAKPDGITPTTIPFEISSSTTNNNGPDKLPYTDAMLNGTQDILLSTFTTSSAFPTGTPLYTWSSQRPLFGSTFDGVTSAPHNLIKALFSRAINYEMELVFVPVKVSDSRAIFGIWFYYSDNPPPVDLTDPTEYNRDNMEITVSQSLVEHVVPVPLYWGTDSLPTMLANQAYPLLGPRTTVQVVLKEQFVPNMIQPPNFDTNVFLRFKKIESYGFASNSLSDTPTLSWLYR
jgi:hypothetical protein